MHPPIPPTETRGGRTGSTSGGALLASIALLAGGYVAIATGELLEPLGGPGLVVAVAIGFATVVATPLVAVRLGRVAADAIRSLRERVDAPRDSVDATRGRDDDRAADARPRALETRAPSRTGPTAWTASAPEPRASACED